MFEEFTKKLTKVMKGMESFSDGDYNLPAYKKMDEKIGDLLDGIKAKYINQGSSRVTYRLNKDYVIKLAMNDIGIAQNLNEVAYFKLKNKGSKALLNTLLIKSLVNMLVATSALIIIFTKKEAVLNLLVYIIAADLIASAFVDLLDSFIIRKAGLDYSYSPLRFQALLGFAFGILFIVFPQFIGKTGLTIIAVIFIVIGLLVSFYAYHVYVLGKMMKKATAAPQIQEASAEFEEKNE